MAVTHSSEPSARFTDPNSVAAAVTTVAGVAAAAVEPGARLLIGTLRVGMELVGAGDASGPAPRVSPARIHFPPEQEIKN